jgi:hypothetical protein
LGNVAARWKMQVDTVLRPEDANSDLGQVRGPTRSNVPSAGEPEHLSGLILDRSATGIRPGLEPGQESIIDVAD